MNMRPNPLETLKTPPASNTPWWDAFERHLAAGHAWEEAAKLAWRDTTERDCG